MTQTQWAEPRQVGLATLDHEAAVRAAECGVGLAGELCHTLIRSSDPGPDHRADGRLHLRLPQPRAHPPALRGGHGTKPLVRLT